MKKEFLYRGKKVEELKAMSIKQFAQIIPSRARRSLDRGLTPMQKIVVDKLEAGEDNIKTHVRDMVILPAMIGKTISVHNGKAFVPVHVSEEMMGHFLGEYALTRNRVAHNAPGVGATRSSAAI